MQSYVILLWLYAPNGKLQEISFKTFVIFIIRTIGGHVHSSFLCRQSLFFLLLNNGGQGRVRRYSDRAEREKLIWNFLRGFYEYGFGAVFCRGLQNALSVRRVFIIPQRSSMRIYSCGGINTPRLRRGCWLLACRTSSTRWSKNTEML